MNKSKALKIAKRHCRPDDTVVLLRFIKLDDSICIAYFKSVSKPYSEFGLNINWEKRLITFVGDQMRSNIIVDSSWMD